MNSRRYYSVRKGINPNSASIDLRLLKTLFIETYTDLLNKDFFQESFGYYCVDEGDVPGTLGSNIKAQFQRRLRKDDLWPIYEKCQDYTEDDLFDVIELLYDLVSKPCEGTYHSFNNCGWHYSSFDRDAGRNQYRIAINELLADYDDGYELSEEGEILLNGQDSLDQLMQAPLPPLDPENVNGRVTAAVMKFRRYHSTSDDRRDAIRDLADVLEYLRPKLSVVITDNDENDLFNLANRFGIRHHNDRQKTTYDKAVWYNWMFYYYLATIHAVTRLLKKYEATEE